MRLFVGLDLPAVAKDELARVIDELRRREPDAKWVPRDNLHLTLSFLGEVAEERLDGIREALSLAAGESIEIRSRLSGVGAFPSARRARVVWVGMEDRDGAAASLAASVARALEPLGFEPEKRAFSPHLTLARLRAPQNVTPLLDEAVASLDLVVPELTLFRSRLARPAPRYESLAGFPLG